MLRRTMDEVRASGGAVTVAELGRRLGAEPGAVEGMLEALVGLGRLRVETLGGCGDCRGCGHARACAGTAGGGLKVYVLAQP